MKYMLEWMGFFGVDRFFSDDINKIRAKVSKFHLKNSGFNGENEFVLFKAENNNIFRIDLNGRKRKI